MKKDVGGRPSGFKERCTIAVYLDRDMHDEFREFIGGIPASTYIRGLIEKDMRGEEEEEITSSQ